jgi:hypothetical protein
MRRHWNRNKRTVDSAGDASLLVNNAARLLTLNGAQRPSDFITMVDCMERAAFLDFIGSLRIVSFGVLGDKLIQFDIAHGALCV